MSDATDNRFYREKQPAVSESLRGLIENIKHKDLSEAAHPTRVSWNKTIDECLEVVRQYEVEQPQDDEILHGLDMAEIFVIKNAHALNAPPVLTAIKEAQAIIRSRT